MRSNNLTLHTPVQYVKGVGPAMAARLKKLGIETVEDLLLHAPFRYEDFSLLTPIVRISSGETVTIHATVVSITNVITRHGKNLQRARVADATGHIDVVWFNQPYLINAIRKGAYVALSGKTTLFNNQLSLQSPTYEILGTADAKQETSVHTGRLVPIYPETANVSSKWIRGKIHTLLEQLKADIADYLPRNIQSSLQLMDRTTAIEQVHFPQNHAKAQAARKRLAFDELFLLQLTALTKKAAWQKQTATKRIVLDQQKRRKLEHSLGFSLTGAQIRALDEILHDLTKNVPMNRLLQGDVGSGKTVVAAIAAQQVALSNASTLIMAPTQILALQQQVALQKMLKPFDIPVILHTSAHKIKTTLKNPCVVVGTHALLHRSYPSLTIGLLVIDEQHRFGVAQRAGLRNVDGQSQHVPHVLTMTATPIPRTTMLTLHGDLDVSVLDEMPLGRKPVKTWVVVPVKRLAAYEWIRKQKGLMFIVCPFIEPSETQTSVKAATQEYHRLKTEIFPDIPMGLLHGKMKATEKRHVLEDFGNQTIRILVSTPVVEVGIDIPAATIMLVEAAERFGLAQLHQLRGRVGRADVQSYCLLFTESRNRQTIQRLSVLEREHIGAHIAQADLELRGPGDIYSTLQHGFGTLRFAQYSDTTLLARARDAAFQLLSADPKLASTPLLRKQLEAATIGRISPD